MSSALAEIPAVRQRHALVIGPSGSEVDATLEAALLGWEIERAVDGPAACALLQRQPFDLVITDEDTSGKSDVELLRKIRMVRPHTRVIILTCESTPADVIASLRERAFSYFSRPFSSESLAEMVRMAADEPCWDDGIEVLSATPQWIRLLARCDRRTADRLLQFFREIADLPDGEREGVASALREMLLNAIEHGGHFDPGQYVEISYLRARRLVLCRVKDPGQGFSLKELQHAAIANPSDDPLRHNLYRAAQGLRPGGFGVLMTRHLVDEVIYGEQGNDVLLIKYLSSLDRPATVTQAMRHPSSC